jgi:hypothetical protein
MKVYKEDWSEESMPLRKSKEPEGKIVSSALCVLCNKRIRTIDGKLLDHPCVSLKKKHREEHEEAGDEGQQ